MGFSDYSRSKLDVTNKHPDFLTPELKERFPLHSTYFVPPIVVEKLRFSDGYPRWWEHYPETYDNILHWHPKAPQTSSEQAEGAASFWRMHAKMFSITSQNGTIELKPDQTIIDHFKHYEKWITRRYFAATGKIEKCSIEENCRLQIELLRAREHEKKGAQEKLDNFYNYTLPNHVVQMGGWFCAGVKRAFDDMHQPVKKPLSGTPKPSTTDDGEPVVY